MSVSRETRADQLFGSNAESVLKYADLLKEVALPRGLIGPAEAERIWDRHIENCFPITRLFDEGSQVLDVGSGAGLPGIVIALARPDLKVTLMEPLKRRSDFLREVSVELGLPIEVITSKAERAKGSYHHITARAVAPLPKLVESVWHLLKPQGSILAIKGERAPQEIEELRSQGVRGSSDLAIELKEIPWGDSMSRIVIIRPN